MSPSPRTRLPVARIDALDALLGRAPTPPPPPPPPGLAVRPEEPADPDEVLRDYVLAPYPPRRDPRGGLRAVNLLVESFALAGLEARGVAVIDRLRAQLGPGRTVWGVKYRRGAVASPSSIGSCPDGAPTQDDQAGALSWELYVYDPDRERAEATVDAVGAALAGVVEVPGLDRPIAHHMWSLELDAGALAGRGPGRLTVYVNGADRAGASRSYTLDGRGPALANLYTFHDPRTQPRAILERVRTSVHLGAPPDGVAAVIWPGLHRCRRLCVANKRHADGLYFSGVDTDQLAHFLARLDWPAALRAHVDGRRHRYAHLAWDVGFDFTIGDRPGAPPRIDKSAVYATC